MELLIIILLLAIIAEVAYVGYRTNRNRPGSGAQRIFVDTSALIDERILPVSASGFVTSTLSIPRSVVGELQLLADSADGEKRIKARRGLDVIGELQELDTVTVEIFADSRRAEEGVDNRLLTLAKKYGGSICTVDYNLNKVAKVEGIQVLNVNELALSLRMPHAPGERTMIELTTKGNSHKNQAVGHLEDGTMVVVEQAKSKIGQRVEVEFIRSLQTSAGRMMFAKLVGEKVEQEPAKAVSVKKAVSQGRGRAKKMNGTEAKKEAAQSVRKPSSEGQMENVRQNDQTKKPDVKTADSEQRPTQARQSPKRVKPRTSAQREASLIELVNSQD